MKLLTIVLIFISIFYTKLNSQIPILFNANVGVFYSIKDDINADWQLDGKADLKSKNIRTIFLGIGLMEESFYSTYFLGLDLLYSIRMNDIDRANLKNIYGINNENDTMLIHATASSKFDYSSIILSPSISFRQLLFEPFSLIISLRPQLIYNFDPEINNSITLSDTNFINFIGKPEIKRDNKNKIITDYSWYPNDIRNFDLNCILSIGFRTENKYEKVKMMLFRFDFLIGLSPIKNRGLIMYPGFSIQFSF